VGLQRQSGHNQIGFAKTRMMKNLLSVGSILSTSLLLNFAVQSANPSVGHGDESNGGPARPEVLAFKAGDSAARPVSLPPVWQGEPK